MLVLPPPPAGQRRPLGRHPNVVSKGASPAGMWMRLHPGVEGTALQRTPGGASLVCFRNRENNLKSQCGWSLVSKGESQQRKTRR